MPVRMNKLPEYAETVRMNREWFARADYNLIRATANGFPRVEVERLVEARERARRGYEGVLVEILAGNKADRLERMKFEAHLTLLNKRTVLADTIRCAHQAQDVDTVAPASQPLPIYEDGNGFYTDLPEVAAAVLPIATAGKVVDVVVVERPGKGAGRVGTGR